MFARTPRLLLRPGWLEDAPALARALRGEARSSTGFADAMADAEAFLAKPSDAVVAPLLVTLRTDSAPVIIGTAHLVVRPSGVIEADCWIGDAHQDGGYAAEALRALRDVVAILQQRPDEVPLAA